MKMNMIDPKKAEVDNLNSMTTTSTDTVEKQNKPSTPKSAVDAKVKKRNDEFRARIETSKQYRRKLVANWTVSIDYRRGKPFTSQTDDDQVAVNLDWILTKEKVAALFSQVPQARLVHAPETLDVPWVPSFERMVNDNLVQSGVEAMMFEVLPDCINASGLAAALVSYETITESKEVPETDLSTLSPDLQDEAKNSQTINGEPISTTVVPNSVDKRYLISRISPADLLWSNSFVGSDFDKSPWIGRSGKVTWPEAMRQFNLKESDRDNVMGEDKTTVDKLTHDVERDKSQADDMVGFDEIYYRDHQFEENAKSFNSIHRLVFVTGKDEPVVDEPWKGQKVNDDGSIIGVTRYPIQVLTLSYITDEAVPPSDSAIGRAQTNELNKGRTQQIQQRQRSLPVRWFDVNRVDPAIQQGLMRGTWQAMIPVQGEGTRIIGEVTRATMPSENYKFDDVAKADLRAQWGVGSGSDLAANDEENADPNQNKSPFNTQVGVERARVASFFCRIAEILGGLLCLYEDPASIGQGFDPMFSNLLKFTVMADSTVLMDAGQRLSRLNQFMDLYGKSGWVDTESTLKEIASLVGLDASVAIKPPMPKIPDEPNISLRLTGVEDMLNPLTLAFLIKSKQAPDSQTIEMAKQLIQQAVVPQQAAQGQDAGGGLPQPQGALPPPSPAPPPGAPQPPPAPPGVGEAHPNWTTMPKLDKRTDGGKG